MKSKRLYYTFLYLGMLVMLASAALAFDPQFPNRLNFSISGFIFFAGLAISNYANRYKP